MPPAPTNSGRASADSTTEAKPLSITSHRDSTCHVTIARQGSANAVCRWQGRKGVYDSANRDDEELMDFDEAQVIASRYAPSDYYDREYRGMEQMYMPALLSVVEEYPVGRVLEIGPGWGTTAVWLNARGYDVSVMDLVPVGEFMSQELIDEYDVTYLHHDVEDSARPDGVDVEAFDLIIMTQVIHHLSWRPDRALQHVGELMNPGATYITSVLDRKSYRRLDSAFGNRWRNVPEWKTTERSPDTIKCMYDEKEFRSLLENQFSQVNIWKPKRSTVLFAKATQ